MKKRAYRLGYISTGQTGRIHAVTQEGPLCTTATPREFIPVAEAEVPTCAHCVLALRYGAGRFELVQAWDL